MRANLPGPMRRRGPRPLLLHLMGGTSWSESCLTGWPGSNGGWPGWNAADPRLIRGIAAYRRHPWQRTLADPAAIWSEGSTRVLDFGTAGDMPVLFVPSLVNRSYVLDLMPGQSMMRWLGSAGVRPLLLAWGWPDAAERRFTLTDHVAGRIERALMALPGPVVLAGYCMGGLLALAAALRRPDQVRALALLATPWDFHAAGRGVAMRLARMLPAFEPVMQATGTLPVDALQSLFAALDPSGIAAKFRAFGAMDQGGEAAARFVALEDWLNDGVPLGAAIARETIGGWYGANTPARGEWRIAGERVTPGRLSMPCFVAVPGRDRIVPPESAMALARAIPGAVAHRPAAGHVGMVAGRAAEASLWQPLLGWLRGL